MNARRIYPQRPGYKRQQRGRLLNRLPVPWAMPYVDINKGWRGVPILLRRSVWTLWPEREVEPR